MRLHKFYKSEKMRLDRKMVVRSMINNKRGLSPLIATILLIAFAVALGAVVMNLGRTIGDGELPFNGEAGCGVSGKLEIAEIGGEYKICFAEMGKESYVDFTIHNGASADINDLQVTIYGSNDVFNMDSILKEVMKRGEGRRIKIKYDNTVYGNIEKFVIIPKVEHDGSIVLCDEAKLELEEIGSCQ